MKQLITNTFLHSQVIKQMTSCPLLSGTYMLCMYPYTRCAPRCYTPWWIVGLGNVPFHTTSLKSAYQLKKNLKDCYHLMNVDPENSDLSDVKGAFLKLAKDYHPDSRSKTADAAKFNQIQEAYQAIRTDLEARDTMGENRNQDLEFDIEHTAPQHRQYLEFEGIGSGTPSQRQSHFQKVRVARAANSVSDRRMEKLMLEKETSALVSLDKKAAKQIKTTNVIDRLVEDLIKDAINKGEFDNLKNKGKPLPDRTSACPFWDVSERNLNQVLVNNGYAPEWIQAEREIRGKLQDLRSKLLTARLKLGPEPLNDFNRNKWEGLKESFADSIKTLNKKVERRNLLVPLMQLQMVNFRPQREIDKVLKEYEEGKTRDDLKNSITIKSSAQQGEEFNFNTSFLSKIGDKIYQKLFFPDKERMEN